MKKLAVLLSLLMMMPSLTMVACSEDTSSDNSSDMQNDAAPVETEMETEPDIYAEGLAALSDTGYNGAEFSLLTRAKELYESFSEELTGESTNDIIFERNAYIEEQFDVTLNITSAENHDILIQMMTDSVMANDMLYDLVAQRNYKASELIAKGLCGNWLDISPVNLDAPWWTQMANEDATINNKLFAITGDFCITNMLYLYVMFYNADAAVTHGITAESLQNAVLDGTWTYDTFNSLVKDLYEDTNGDGTADASDLYGMVLSSDNMLDAWLTAFDQPIFEVTPSEKMNITLVTDKTISALEKVYSLYHENAGTFNFGEWKTQDAQDAFNSGHGVFLAGQLNDARTRHADVNFNLGILPYPKWDEAQKEYYSVSGDIYSALVYPMNTPESDYAFIGTITEALTIVTSRDVAPVFFDSALKGRYSMDQNTAEIVDIIMNGRCFDFSIQWGNQLQIPYMFRNLIIEKSTDLSSTYARTEKSIQTNLAMIEKIYGIGE